MTPDSKAALESGFYEVPAGKIATVVTSLEMHARPALREAPAGPWTLRRVARPDPAWYRDLYNRIGESYMWFSRRAMRDEALAPIIQHPDITIDALVLDGADEGLLELDFRAPGTCEVAYFGVTPRCVGTGAGRWLMNHAMTKAWSRPISRLWIHTCTFDHADALPFYQRSGFRAFRRQIEVLDDPRLSGAYPATASPQIPVIG